MQIQKNNPNFDWNDRNSEFQYDVVTNLHNNDEFAVNVRISNKK